MQKKIKKSIKILRLQRKLIYYKKILEKTQSIILKLEDKLEDRLIKHNILKREIKYTSILNIFKNLFNVKLGKLNIYKKNFQEKYVPKKINNKYKLSIVVPNYNGEKYLNSTLQSIVRQKLTKYEIIFKDNLSTDKSLIIAKRFKKKIGNKIKILIKSDKGQTNGINQGLKQASGDIFCWINSDDMYLKETFKILFEFMEKNKLDPLKDEFAIYGNRILINENQLEVNRWILPYHDKQVLYYADYIPQETLFWSKKAMKKLKKLNEKFQFAMDWELLLRMLNKNIKFYHINKFLGCFRVHDKQKTQTQISGIGQNEIEILRNRNRKQFYKKNINFYVLKFFIFSHLLDKFHSIKKHYYDLKANFFS
jgi:glycosyltransferase involved in cell wall biosynthesis